VSLEGKRGWINVVSTDNRVDELFESLGKTWETEKNAFKPFPCGIVIHPVIDACIQLGKELKIKGKKLEDITSIELDVHRLVLELTGKKRPKDGLEGKFSVYHGAAIGLVLGKATPAEYEDSIVCNQKIIEVRDKVQATVRDDIPPESCRARITMANGDYFQKDIQHAIGSVEKPLAENELTEKFIDQSAKVLGGDEARKYSDACWSLESVIDICDFLPTS
jgi:aconitate decarboxylase